jgi:peptidoglycan/xylan/chitin deacetylase (PgdA/CDA1 family)
MTSVKNPLILTYHSISEGRSPLKVPPGLFVEQMEWLKRNARVASLGEVIGALTQGRPLPERTVVLTFDDGFLDFYSHAAPAVRRFGFAATVFLPVAHCGKTNAWSGQPRWVDAQPLMDWKQIAELAEQGISFGSHSLTHPVLSELPGPEFEREIAESKREIEIRTGRPVEHFCYPFGRWNAAVRESVRRHYAGACSTAARILTPDADPYALPRVDAHYVRRVKCFRSLFTPRFRAYLAMRWFIRRLRGQPEGS